MEKVVHDDHGSYNNHKDGRRYQPNQEDIDNETDALKTASANFDDAIKSGIVVPTPILVDKEALKTKRKEAKDVERVATSKGGKNIAKDQQWTTKDELKRFNEAIESAEKILKKEKADQAEVDQAVTDLEDAIAAYEENQKDGKQVEPDLDDPSDDTPGQPGGDPSDGKPVKPGDDSSIGDETSLSDEKKLQVILRNGLNDEYGINLFGSVIIYVQGESKGVAIEIEGSEDNELPSVKVDGKPLTEGRDYVEKKGSIIVDFSKSFLDQLETGVHHIGIEMTKGRVDQTLLVQAGRSGKKPSEPDQSKKEAGEHTGKTSDKKEDGKQECQPASQEGPGQAPQTGDAMDMGLYLSLVIVAGAGLYLVNKKKETN